MCMVRNEGCYGKFLVEKLSKLKFEKNENGTRQHEKKMEWLCVSELPGLCLSLSYC